MYLLNIFKHIIMSSTLKQKVLAFLNKANETFYIVVFNIVYVCLQNAYEGCQ